MERPIIFSGEMVRALLDGRKTQTRRVIKPQPSEGGLKWATACGGEFAAWQDPLLTLDEYSEDGGPCQRVCPYGQPGDLLWVRETHAFLWPDEDPVPIEECIVQYKADSGDLYPGQWPAEEAIGNPNAPKWRPSIHMPKWAARIWLKITDVRVERVQDISEEDARAEGVQVDENNHVVRDDGINWGGAVYKFAELWDSINDNRGYGWEVNPWVWILEFTRQEIE